MVKAKHMMMWAQARAKGYPDRIIERAIIMHTLDGRTFFEKEWTEYLSEADDERINITT
jgi:hypothetical protein